MPKNKGKGGKQFRKGKKEDDSDEKRELVIKDVGQEYAMVEQMMGDCRVKAKCCDNIERECHIRGKMRKKVWISKGDIILVSVRDFEPDKADVILKYSANEARKLQEYGQLDKNLKINETMEEDDSDDDNVEFKVDDL